MQKVTSNVQSIPIQSPDIYWHSELFSRRPCSVYQLRYHGKWLKLFTIFLPFCAIIIKCTETFWSPCTWHTHNELSNFYTKPAQCAQALDVWHVCLVQRSAEWHCPYWTWRLFQFDVTLDTRQAGCCRNPTWCRDSFTETAVLSLRFIGRRKPHFVKTAPSVTAWCYRLIGRRL
jgi:hypothetical protein